MANRTTSDRGFAHFIKVYLAQPQRHPSGCAGADPRPVDLDHRHHEHAGRGDKGLIRRPHLGQRKGAFLNLIWASTAKRSTAARVIPARISGPNCRVTIRLPRTI